jgi:hypothetical protein
MLEDEVYKVRNRVSNMLELRYTIMSLCNVMLPLVVHWRLFYPFFGYWVEASHAVEIFHSVKPSDDVDYMIYR